MVKFNELLLDTNFLVECAKRQLLERAKELVPGAKVITLQAVVDELMNQEAKVALEIVKSEDITVKPMKGYADKLIEEYAGRGDVAVATNDRELKEKLRGRGVAVVVPTKNGCDIIGGIV